MSASPPSKNIMKIKVRNESQIFFPNEFSFDDLTCSILTSELIEFPQLEQKLTDSSNLLPQLEQNIFLINITIPFIKDFSTF